jgi:pimeloyl-ACP methyl ester carboxylesterase
MARRLVLLLAAVAGLATTAPPALAQTQTPTPRCGHELSCRTVTVPLDRSGAVPGTLKLPVRVQRGHGPVLLALGGGPGQSMATGHGAHLIPRLHAMSAMRVAIVDQRGTGATAIRCGALQRASLSDLTVPPRGAVGRCATSLGARRAFYSTTDTVADLEAIRRALGVHRWALLGVSYGTYVAERYARAHPDRVTHLVLDSVVEQRDDPFFVQNLRRAGTVLRQLCVRGSDCRTVTDDPVGELHRLVTRTNRRPIRGQGVAIDGPSLLDTMTTLASFMPADFAAFPRLVHAALDGRPQPLLRLTAAVRRGNAEPATSLSMGLHAATLCADFPFPWGGADATAQQRRTALRAATRALPSDLGPFDRTTAAGNGTMVTCLRWPPTDVAPAPAPGPLPAVPILVLAGSWDLSTPLDSARAEARRSPTARLVVLPQLGHATILQPCTQPAVARFFAGRPLGHPCAHHRAPKRLPT